MENVTDQPAPPEYDSDIDGFEIALGILALLCLVIACSACASGDPACARGRGDAWIPEPPNRI